MAQECLWFDRFEVEVQGRLVYFVGHSEQVRCTSRVTRETAIKFAYDILAGVEQFDARKPCDIVQLSGKG